jgi:hypothetical protein
MEYFQKVGRENICTVGFDADSQRKEPRAGIGTLTGSFVDGTRRTACANYRRREPFEPVKWTFC